MSYSVELIEGTLLIKKENEDKIVKALKDFVSSRERTSWVLKSEVEDCKTLAEILGVFRYSLEKFRDMNEDTTEYLVYFEGQKLGDEDEFMPITLDLCEEKSEIRFRGEDGEVFGYTKGKEYLMKSIKLIDSYEFDKLLETYRNAVKVRDDIEIANIEHFLKEKLVNGRE